MQHTLEGLRFTEIVLEIFKLNGLLITEGDQLTKALGLSSARWKVLGALALSNSPMTVPQIASAMGQTRQGVQKLTDAMQKDGMLAYQDNPHHKRAKLVVLTDRGQEAYSLLDEKQVPWANSSAAGISATDMEVTMSVLRKMIQNFESEL